MRHALCSGESAHAASSIVLRPCAHVCGLCDVRDKSVPLYEVQDAARDVRDAARDAPSEKRAEVCLSPCVASKNLQLSWVRSKQLCKLSSSVFAGN